MNIFVTDVDPVQAAINLDDKRVRHMVKENIEMLAIYIHSVLNIWVVDFPLWGKDIRNEPNFLYNHPCSKWVRKDKANMSWLFRHTVASFDEHEYRFDTTSEWIPEFIKVREHLANHLLDRVPNTFQNSSLFKDLPVIEAYRKTMINKWYVTDKIKPVLWTKRNPPTWLNQSQQLSL